MLKQLAATLFIGFVIAAGVSFFESNNGQLSQPDTEEGVSRRPVMMSATASPVSTGRAIEISKGRDGHFRTTVKLNYADVPVMIDTGASLLALRESDARKAGIYPRRDDYTYSVSTANGTVMAAGAEVRELTIGTVRIRNVEAFILPDEALATNLLGMNVLSQFGEVSFRGDRLVLDSRAG
ncbi:TIGR02281 family clan AA aspartic protease [Parvularcula flava]|uniref:Peptidase n=1 Tax=Aquisalinus luteolus TaxID=1566827 RepID=A0A8J3A2C3_9PROT|nr:TIGR02281 family clan AA aspartic protease [Aquisalinus luteolus]NHK28013.1 TIGR02281 family clan AA aspartic protease [Aquisalinus luteolus]GGH97203.1 peptidase [Aquisalinus luteolus]